jgi:aspartokinase
VCSPLAASKINISLLAHVARGAGQASFTTWCTDLAAGADSYSLVKGHMDDQGTLDWFPETCIITLFPHEKRAEIKGNFLHSLAQARVIIRAVASSPSAISAVLSLKDKDRSIRQLFGHFQFPAYNSPQEFYALQRPPEELVREVVASYQEQTIRVYAILAEPDLDLWVASIPSAATLGGLALALIDLGELRRRVHFLVAAPGPDQRFLMAFGMKAAHLTEIQELFQAHIPDITMTRLSSMAAIFLHGPHFGDRYGIADALVRALEQAGISPAALSCTVSSISVMIDEAELPGAVKVLGETFEDQSKRSLGGT